MPETDRRGREKRKVNRNHETNKKLKSGRYGENKNERARERAREIRTPMSGGLSITTLGHRYER